MSRICIVCISLKAGGTERVVSTLANHFSSEHEVDVILLSNKKPFYELAPNVGLWKFSGKESGFRRMLYYLRLARFIRTTVKTQQPDVVLSFGELISPFVRMALLRLPLSFFVFNQGAPYRSMRGISGLVNPLIYPLADSVVLQTDQSLRILEKRYKFCNFRVIPNPLELPRSTPAMQERRKVIVNVGSIGRLKNQEFLLKSFAGSGDTNEWELHFVGDGPDRPRLEAMAEDIGLSHRIKFLGQRTDVSKILSNSQVFAFTSLSEGLPNALAEALAHGCACISFDCPTGPSELILNEKSGFLVPMGEDRQYQEQLCRLLSDVVLRSRFGEEAKQDMRQYSFEKVLGKYEQLVSGAAT